MSNRTLIEINHDYAHDIEHHPEEFVEYLVRFLRSGSRDIGDGLSGFGVRIIAMRHDSEEFRIPPKTDGFSKSSVKP